MKHAKAKSWRDFCSNTESTGKMVNVSNKLTNGKIPKIGLITREDGSATESPEEVLDALFDCFFPGSHDQSINHF